MSMRSLSNTRSSDVSREADREECEFALALQRVTALLDAVRHRESEIRSVSEGKRDESLTEARQREADHTDEIDELHRQRERYRSARNAFRHHPRAAEELVAPGSVVTVCFDDAPAVTQTLVVTERHADSEYDTVGPRSQLGRAIMWRKSGDIVAVDAPGRRLVVTIRAVRPGFAIARRRRRVRAER